MDIRLKQRKANKGIQIIDKPVLRERKVNTKREHTTRIEKRKLRKRAPASQARAALRRV